MLTREEEARLLAVGSPSDRAWIILGIDTLLRLNRAPFTSLAVGDPVVFARSRPPGDESTHPTPRCSATIKSIVQFPSFAAAGSSA